MEARRLAILASHLRPITITTNTASNFTTLASPASSDTADCVFCRIVRRQSHAFVLYEDDVCMCILDLNPLCLGHSLIIPRSHFSSLGTTPPSVVAAMCSKIPYLSNAIMKATNSDAFNLLVNNGAAADVLIFKPTSIQSLQRHPLLLDDTAPRLADSVREHLKFPDEKEKENAKGQETCISKNK
ncbi:hypothetical protein QQ045_033193 [Rhodiola kirilowii]